MSLLYSPHDGGLLPMPFLYCNCSEGLRMSGNKLSPPLQTWEHFNFFLGHKYFWQKYLLYKLNNKNFKNYILKRVSSLCLPKEKIET